MTLALPLALPLILAKAGITTVLNSRTSVLAAANPTFGRYQDEKNAAEQVDFQSTILTLTLTLTLTVTVTVTLTLTVTLPPALTLTVPLTRRTI